MYIVTFQVHGSADIRNKFFNDYSSARMWSDAHDEVLSFSFIHEVFH